MHNIVSCKILLGDNPGYLFHLAFYGGLFSKDLGLGVDLFQSEGKGIIKWNNGVKKKCQLTKIVV